MKAKKFQDLIVWQKAHAYVLAIYKLTKKYPKEEMYGLTSQFRRAAISIAANITEVFKKKSVKDKIKFYNISQGSIEECKYYLILTSDLGYVNTDSLYAMIEEVS